MIWVPMQQEFWQIIWAFCSWSLQLAVKVLPWLYPYLEVSLGMSLLPNSFPLLAKFISLQLLTEGPGLLLTFGWSPPSGPRGCHRSQPHESLHRQVTGHSVVLASVRTAWGTRPQVGSPSSSLFQRFQLDEVRFIQVNLPCDQVIWHLKYTCKILLPWQSGYKKVTGSTQAQEEGIIQGHDLIGSAVELTLGWVLGWVHGSGGAI